MRGSDGRVKALILGLQVDCPLRLPAEKAPSAVEVSRYNRKGWRVARLVVGHEIVLLRVS